MKNYISLMKLRVVELLLVTTLPALFLASDGVPDLAVTIWCLVGGTFAAGGANAFNMVIEAKSDLLMKRTAKRPIATGEISKTNGLIFATVISVISLSIFAAFTTPLATLLTFLAITFYVFGYTLALKKHTSQNIVWGGIAGCMPVLIGQAAVTNSLTLTSWLFFLLICNKSNVVSLTCDGGSFPIGNTKCAVANLAISDHLVTYCWLEATID
jgi:protoheme IX farnesyltransferase